MAVMRKAHPKSQIAPGIWNFTGVDLSVSKEIEVIFNSKINSLHRETIPFSITIWDVKLDITI